MEERHGSWVRRHASPLIKGGLYGVVALGMTQLGIVAVENPDFNRSSFQPNDFMIALQIANGLAMTSLAFGDKAINRFHTYLNRKEKKQ